MMHDNEKSCNCLKYDARSRHADSFWRNIYSQCTVYTIQCQSTRMATGDLSSGYFEVKRTCFACTNGSFFNFERREYLIYPIGTANLGIDEEQDMEMYDSLEGSAGMVSKRRHVTVVSQFFIAQKEVTGRLYERTVRRLRYRRPVCAYRTSTSSTSYNKYSVRTCFSFCYGGRGGWGTIGTCIYSLTWLGKSPTRCSWTSTYRKCWMNLDDESPLMDQNPVQRVRPKGAVSSDVCSLNKVIYSRLWRYINGLRCQIEWYEQLFSRSWECSRRSGNVGEFS